MIYNKKNAFTLIEILVVIVIVWIVTLWASSLYSKNLWDRQKLSIETNKFITIIESIKNNALVGKWVWVDLITPDYYNVVVWYDEAWSWYVLSSYNTWTTENINFPSMSLEKYDIRRITCSNLDWSNSDNTIKEVTIKYEWNNISATWCNDPSRKVIDVMIWYKSFSSRVKLNTISWVMEEVRFWPREY